MSRPIAAGVRIAERVPGAGGDVVDGGSATIAVGGVDEADRGAKPGELAVATEAETGRFRGERGGGARGDVVGVEIPWINDDVDEVRPRTRGGDVGTAAEGVQRGTPGVDRRVVSVEVAVVEHDPELVVLPRAMRERSDIGRRGEGLADVRDGVVALELVGLLRGRHVDVGAGVVDHRMRAVATEEEGRCGA